MTNDEDEIDHNKAPSPAERNQRVANANRPKHQFQPGQSGNPTGRPRNPKNIAELRELAREKTGAMLEFLSKAALNPKVSMTVRVQAATEVLNRGWGRPQQSLDLNHGVQSDLAQLLEEIDGKNKIRIIDGTIERPALEAKQPLLDNGQVGPEGPIQIELGTTKSDG